MTPREPPAGPLEAVSGGTQEGLEASEVARWEALHEGHTIDCEELQHGEPGRECVCGTAPKPPRAAPPAPPSPDSPSQGERKQQLQDQDRAPDGAVPPTLTVPTSLLWAARGALDDVNGLLGGEGDPEGEEVATIAELVRDRLDAMLRPTVFPPGSRLATKARERAAEYHSEKPPKKAGPRCSAKTRKGLCFTHAASAWDRHVTGNAPRAPPASLSESESAAPQEGPAGRFGLLQTDLTAASFGERVWIGEVHTTAEALNAATREPAAGPSEAVQEGQEKWMERARWLLLSAQACLLDLDEPDGRGQWDARKLARDIVAFLRPPSHPPAAGPPAVPALPSCTPMRCRIGLDFHHCEAAGHLAKAPPALPSEPTDQEDP